MRSVEGISAVNGGEEVKLDLELKAQAVAATEKPADPWRFVAWASLACSWCSLSPWLASWGHWNGRSASSTCSYSGVLHRQEKQGLNKDP